MAGSFVHFATVCTRLCWINSATHQRSQAFPLGLASHPYITQGNVLAGITAALALLAWCRGCCFSIENPRGSSLIEHPCMQLVVRWLREKDHQGFGTCCLKQHSVSLGKFGAPTQKPALIYSADVMDSDLPDPAQLEAPHPASSAPVCRQCHVCNCARQPCLHCRPLRCLQRANPGIQTITGDSVLRVLEGSNKHKSIRKCGKLRSDVSVVHLANGL